MTFSLRRTAKPLARHLASPLALAAVAALGLAGAHAPAAAQKKEKPAPAAKANHSKEFIAAYRSFETLSKAATPDVAAMRAALPGLLAAAKTPDDRHVAGQAHVQVGNTAKDPALQLAGLETMLASGRADPARVGALTFAAAQLAYQGKDYDKTRTYAQKAIELGHTQGDPQLFVAESYFAQNRQAEGLQYLSDMIAAQRNAGKPVSEAVLKRALAVAYNAKLYPQARELSIAYARDFPNQTSWGDAIAIAINSGRFQPPEMLDLLRLARQTKTMRTDQQYLEYVETADARRLPAEVLAVIDEGVAARQLNGNQQFIKDARALANARLKTDRTELAAFQRDAQAPNAKLVTVMAAADTLLSYGRYAEAEALYARAATMPGANQPLVMTRLGIAQAGQGKYEPAKASFDKVDGPRKQIADLWALYVTQRAAGTVIAPAA
ncbi:hypothetical protein [Qipengyuania sediminis]|uniref:hypothetical protein n=1 Tax=Qipengyuania sediminis TaxID=1532023 RepID=UPI00105A8998|nr:hypothetical protein [Qipengyuania sediminis]